MLSAFETAMRKVPFGRSERSDDPAVDSDTTPDNMGTTAIAAAAAAVSLEQVSILLDMWIRFDCLVLR